jgi:hypothetical protein
MRSLGVLVLVLASSCVLEEQRYVVENEAVALTADTAPAFEDEDGNPIFVVQRRFGLPISRPSQAQLDMLWMTPAAPFPRTPWVEREDMELTVDYVLANLGDEPLIATVTLDGENEFHAYAPTPLDFHQWERIIELGPRQRVTGAISELEMDEVAIDLATVVNGAPNSNQVVYFESQSGRDPRVKRYIPKLVPGLVGLRFGIIATSAGNVVLEVSVRAQDHGSRLPERGEERWQTPAPMDFVPVVPEEE